MGVRSVSVKNKSSKKVNLISTYQSKRLGSVFTVKHVHCKIRYCQFFWNVFPTLYIHVASLSGLPHTRGSSYLLMVCPVGWSLYLNQKNCLELCWGLASWSCNPHNLFPVCIDCTALVFFVFLGAVISLFLHGTSVCKLPNVAVCLSS